MTLRLHTIQTDGISQLSYFIGDDSERTAAVIDPRPDCEVYLELAQRYGLSITHAFETHIHADFMTGSLELRRRLGELNVCVSGIGDPDYGFDHTPMADGDRFTFGKALLTARHTPGHTPEHLSFELDDADEPGKPWAVFTGDSLFVGSAGRPDLLGESETEGLTRQLFHTLNDYYRKLDDDVAIFPCHGAGSACGANIGDRPLSTIGREKQTNGFLQFDDEKKFASFVEKGAPPVPAHYPRLKKVNLKATSMGHRPTCPGVTVEQLAALIDKGDDIQLVDTRDMLAFGGGHIEGAINIGNRAELSPWSGDMLDAETPIVLVLNDDALVDHVVTAMWRVGLTKFRGYLVGGMNAWTTGGKPIVTLPQIDVHTLKAHLNDYQILDVRSEDEWQEGHLPGAVHHYAGKLRDGVDGLPKLDKTRDLAVYCGSGYRASVAGSVLQKHGFERVMNVAGSMSAWRAAGYEVSK